MITYSMYTVGNSATRATYTFLEALHNVFDKKYCSSRYFLRKYYYRLLWKCISFWVWVIFFFMQIQEKNCNTNFLRITIFHDNFQMHHTTSSSKFIQSKFHILFSKSKEFFSKQSIWPLKLCQNIIIPFSNWPKLKSEFYFKKNFEKECLD